MTIVRSKIAGAHPSLVALDEIGHATRPDAAGKKYLKEVREVLLGPSSSKRRELLQGGDKTKNLSVDQQVDCLLEAATDGSILRCAFSGWSPLV